MSSDSPAAMRTPFDVGEVNCEITAYDGPATLRKGGDSLHLSQGRIFISPRPSWMLCLEGVGVSEDKVWLQRLIGERKGERIEIRASLDVAGYTPFGGQAGLKLTYARVASTPDQTGNISSAMHLEQ